MKRDRLLQMLWNEQDTAYDLMYEYDSIPHYYGKNVLYQTEAYILREIGNRPDITVTELAEKMKKTKSACSQTVKKLLEKKLAIQIRDDNNRRCFHLRLTAKGLEAYEEHMAFNDTCQQITFDMLEKFSDEELMHHIIIQQVLNESYRKDIEYSIKTVNEKRSSNYEKSD